MGLKCLFGHSWNGCRCEKCGLTRDEGHKWILIENKCIKKCSICDKESSIEHNEHKWILLENKCIEKCSICGKESSIEHNEHKWNGCKCERCGLTRDEGHKWQNEMCEICGKRYEFLFFIAFVGTRELVKAHGLSATKAMIGINKINWKDIILNKYPSAKSMTQRIISDNEWSHPQAGFDGANIDLTPFLIAAGKHMTDVMGLLPEEAINAGVITANNNITFATTMGLGIGFVVIGVPLR